MAGPLQPAVTDHITDVLNTAVNLMSATYQQAFNSLFNNVNETPDVIFAAFATQGALVLTIMQQIQNTLNIISPQILPPGFQKFPVTLTPNPDGTVTVQGGAANPANPVNNPVGQVSQPTS
jgi:hypothetical protein